jgi:protein-disulfide isomerase
MTTDNQDVKPRRRMNRWLIGIEIAALLAVIAAGIYILTGGDIGGSVEASAPQRNTGIYKDDHTLGNPNAPVTVIEYAAPSCPHCAHFFLTVFPQLKKQYIDTGKVYFVFRVFPLMAADGAVEAVARSLPKERYFGVVDLVYRTQPKWDPEYGVTNVRDALVAVLSETGVTAAQFDKILADQNMQNRINQIAQDGETKYDIHAVPTFVVNGKVMENKGDVWQDMKAAIDAGLSRH